MFAALPAAAVGALNAIAPSAVASNPSSPAATWTRLTARQMFMLADRALEQGRAQTAIGIYRALEADPDTDVRAEARFRHAKQLIASNRKSAAAVLLRAVIDEKPDATGVRLQLAKLLHELGDGESALRQLRAAQATGLPPEVARLVDRYSEALRASRPIGASFEVAFAPDSNINRATRSDTIGTVLGDFEVNEDSSAKSGVGVALRGQAFRRLPLSSGRHGLLVRASGAADLYRDASFNDFAVDLSAGPDLRLGNSRLTISASASQRWYGLKPFVRSARLSGTLTQPLGRRAQLQLTGSAGLADYRLNDLQDGRTFAGRIMVERALSETMGVGVNVSGSRNGARDPAYATTEWRAGILGWRDIGRATITAELEAGRLRADGRLALLPERRSDRYSRVSLGATFRRLMFGGFAPITRISLERNRSSVEFYDYRRTRTEFGVVRAF